MKRRFFVGSRVRPSKDGRDNDVYQSFDWFDKVLVVTHAITKYMPAKQFFDYGKPNGYSPGFDGSAGAALYSLKVEDGADLTCDLYDWELRHA